MPCRSDYMERDAVEAESAKIIGFLRSLDIEPTDPAAGDYYGAPRVIDQDTEKLCAWLGENPNRVSELSLELQIWWRDHQRADARRAEKQKAFRANVEKKNKSLDKLTEEDKQVLRLI